jgi:hypothetical protein
MRTPKQRGEEKADQQTQQVKNELREFIYLDDVSVTSLLSSRDGAIPHEFTDSNGAAYKGDVNGQVEVGFSPFKGRLGSRFESSRSSNAQVVSKATIQTLVKRLCDLEMDDLSLRANLPVSSRPSRRDVERILAQKHDPPEKYWVLPAASLERGQLAEIEVELETDAIFQLSTILATVKELVTENDELRAAFGSAELLDDLISMNSLIEKMMVNLIPLKSRIVDYVAVDTEHGDVIVHQSLYNDLEASTGYTARPLYLVGDTQRDLYWKDIRRVLFTQSRFRVLCRLNGRGVGTSWNPLKLGDSLARVDPTLSKKLAEFGSVAVSTFSGTASAVAQVNDRRIAALTSYGELVADELQHPLLPEDSIALSVLAQEKHHAFKSAGTASSAFSPIREFIERLADQSLTSDTHARLRETACHRQGIWIDGTPLSPTTFALPQLQDKPEELLIDAEIIAIYW